MNLRGRLTLISSSIFGVVFLITSLLVYGSFTTISKRLIFNDLKLFAHFVSLFYLEKDELTGREYNNITTQFRAIENDFEFRIYDEANNVVFGSGNDRESLSADILEQVRGERNTTFSVDDRFLLGTFYEDNQGDFVIVVQQRNDDYRKWSRLLLTILIAAFMIGIFALILLSRLLSSAAYRPISSVIDQVNAIEPNSLDQTIISPKTGDELQQLIDTFNHLLKRLADTFHVQKNFVNYVSHEFKTPLAAIAGNLEVLAQKDRSIEEYRRTATEVVQHVYYIENTLNTLLMVSGLTTRTNAAGEVRIDELVWDVVDQLSAGPKSLISVEVGIDPGNESKLAVRADESQVRLALQNIIENSQKYGAGRPIAIRLFLSHQGLVLSVNDQGQGIPEADLKFVSQPFYRGSNVKHIQGSGLGLSLAAVLLKQNNIMFEVHSQLDKGTTVTLIFPAF